MPANEKPNAVCLGCWVRIDDPIFGEETIHLVEPAEERPEQGRFSTAGPFAKALLGAQPGETVFYDSPNGDCEEVVVLDFGLET